MLDTMLMGIVGRAIDGYEKWANKPTTKASLPVQTNIKKNTNRSKARSLQQSPLVPSVHYHQHVANHIHYHQHR
jgi:hypothetical protein